MSKSMMSPAFATSLARRLSLAAIIALLSGVGVSAQVSATDSSTPIGMAPGAPAASYQLSGFDNINFFNGNLNFNLSLLKVGGRGGVQDTIGLTLDRKWKTETTPQGADFHVYPVPYTWDGLEVGYGPGVLIGRFAGIPTNNTCQGQSTCEGEEAAHSLLRLTFKVGDGTEYELLDTAHGGAPGANTTCFQNCTLTSAENRGKEFVSRDGTSVTFVSDNDLFDAYANSNGYIFEQIFPTGYLMLPNGTRCRIEDGLVKWIRDRNGNKITFAYSDNRVTQITDSIGRVVTISYASPTLPSSDVITYKGFGNVSREIRVHRDLLYNSSSDNSLRSDATLKTYYQLFPLNGSSTSTYFNPIVVTSVELPNEQSYRFKYNSYGELARVELPTGGAMEYDHEGGLAADEGMYTVGGYRFPTQIYRRVIRRRVFADSGTIWQSQTTISKPETSSANDGYVVVENKDYAANRLSKEVHYYYGTAKVNGSADPADPNPWKTGREWKTEVFDSNGTTVLRRSEQTWEQPAAGYSWPLTTAETNDAAGPNNPQVTQSVTTLVDTNHVSKQTFAFDQYNNASDVYQYGFGSGSPGSLVRHTHTAYLTTQSSIDYACDPSSTCSPNVNIANVIHLRNLPTQVSVYDNNNIRRAYGTIEYDNYGTADNFHAALKDWPALTGFSVAGLDPLFTASYPYRGNATGATRYLLDSSGNATGSVTAYSQFDLTGNVVKTIDPRSTSSNIIATTIDYHDNFGAPVDSVESSGSPANSAPSELNGSYAYAFPFAATNALGQTSYSKFDYHLGRSVTSEDINGIVARGFYDDALDRPTQMIRAVNGGADTKSQTTFAYDDTNHVITTTSDQTTFGDNVLKSQTIYDGLGRPIESRQYETSSQYIAVNQVPFVMRQDPDTNAWLAASESSNPHRSNEQPVYSTSFSDALGRVIKLKTPDSAIIRTAYSGNTVTVTDQAGNQRKSVSDALGRLINVYEDPTDLNYLTTYSYDVLDNLTGVSQYDSVSQVTQTRTFVYDSLKRLTSAKNPEMINQQGQQVPVTYQYDNNGNLTQKTDARSITTTYVYDALNRLSTRSYSDNTPPVTYAYDPAITNGKGRLASVTSSISTYTYGSYDALGRVLSATQTLSGHDYSITDIGYDLAGHLKTMKYPSGNFVNYGFDGAGRLNSFTGNLGQGGQQVTNYSTGITYSPFGGLSQEQFGTQTAIYDKLSYNSRGQLAEILTSTSPNDATFDRGKIVNGYSVQCSGAGCSNTDNNGNLMKQENWMPNSSTATFTQKYRYDNLNRLLRVFDGDENNPTWQQHYKYDRYGNRTIDAAATHDVGVPTYNFGVNAATNRLTAPSGTMHYDFAGNLDVDTYSATVDTHSASVISRTYDAENRMTQETQAGDYVAGIYSYDGDGRRVKRSIGGVETRQIYGIGGELLAEYSAAGVLQKEYGYRNGQLLITAEPPVNAGGGSWGPLPTMNDNPVIIGGTTVQARHITELRNAINAVRAHHNLANYSWQYSATTNDYISANPIIEMRTALDQALGSPAGGYCAGLAQGQPVKGIHIQELRDRIISAWNYGDVKLSIPGATSSRDVSQSFDASHAINHNLIDLWSAGDLPPQWIQVDLGQSRTVSRIQLLVDQSPNGHTTHEVYGGPSPDNLSLLGTFDGDTLFHQWLQLTTSAANVRYLKVSTTASPSWVGWAEIEVYGPSTTPAQVHWQVSDHLGTPRMIFDQSGSLATMTRHDYLPFGEELTAGVGGRTTAQGYSASDGVRQHFTQKERDIETGLDYFLARYYSSSQGRFTSTDPFSPILSKQSAADSRIAEVKFDSWISAPQRWNRYTYGLNNPLRYLDDDGRDPQEALEVLKQGLQRLESFGQLAKNFIAQGKANLAATATQMALDAVVGSVSFNAGGLNPTEIEFAKEVAAFEGKSFQGSTRGAQGLDGFLYEGNFNPTNIRAAVELQQNSSGGERRILEDAENHEYSAAKAGRKNLDLYVKTTDKNVTVQSVTKFIYDWGNGGLTNLVNKGTIKRITILTQNGVVRIEKGKISSVEK